MDPSCPSVYKNSHLPFVSTPGCQFQSMADSHGPLNALFSFCFRLTACSLHIQKAIIFTPLFLYLEVNGCLKQTTAFATAAHQPGSFHVKQRVALSSQHLASCRGGCILLWWTHTWSCCHLHNPGLIFTIPHLGLPEAISQSRFPLAYYIFTYIEMKENAASHYLASQLLQRSHSWPFLVMSCSLAIRSPPALTPSFIPPTHMHRFTHTLSGSFFHVCFPKLFNPLKLALATLFSYSAASFSLCGTAWKANQILLQAMYVCECVFLCVRIWEENRTRINKGHL